VRAL